MKVTKSKTRKKSKLVITFDEEKRKEWLTGFGKRKQQRRKFGHDMEAYKKKKKQLEIKKQNKKIQQEKINKLLHNNENFTNAHDKEEEAMIPDVEIFTDDFTTQKFGDSVVVTTSIGYPEKENDENSVFNSEENDTKKMECSKEKNQPQLTLFQRVQLKRKNIPAPSKQLLRKKAKKSKTEYAKLFKNDHKKIQNGKNSFKNKKGIRK